MRRHNTRRFKNGEVRLPRSEEESWRCVMSGKPEVFVLTPKNPLGFETNKWGLKMTVLREEAHNPIIEKEDGAVRVDVPLGASEYLMGKFSLERGTDLKPEELVLIGVLTIKGTRILQSISDHEKIDVERHDACPRLMRRVERRSIEIKTGRPAFSSLRSPGSSCRCRASVASLAERRRCR